MPEYTDDCIYVEDYYGEGPNPPTPGTITWLSPDVTINPGTANSDQAVSTGNTIAIRVHRKAGCNLSAGAVVLADVWIGNPSLVMKPGFNTFKITPPAETPIGLDPATLTPHGGAAKPATRTFSWTPTVGPTTPADDPRQPGHRCLILRAIPDTETELDTFDINLRQHECQRNITVVSVVTQAGVKGAGTSSADAMGPSEDGLWEFPIETTAAGDGAPERVVIRAVRPLKLDPRLVQQALPILRARTRFRGFAVRPAQFTLRDFAAHHVEFERPEQPTRPEVRERPDVGDFPRIRRPDLFDIRDLAQLDRIRRPLLTRVVERFPVRIARPITRLPFIRDTPLRYEAGLDVDPKEITRFMFKADLRKLAVGQAQVFNVRQLGREGRQQGGLTLIFVRER